MDKREKVLAILDQDKTPDYIPAAFFLHFDEACHQGEAAVEKHLQYFRHTDMDFVKIQYENKFPLRSEIEKPEDWAHMPLYPIDFYQDQLDVVKGLVKAAKKEALVILTLYSPFMCAAHTTGDSLLIQH
ncbi:hypothetical protein ACFLZM_07145, partial [Thermodesulfobacteriota bacterium]